MKILLACLCLTSCTSLYRDGKVIARFPSDMQEVYYRQNTDGSCEWTVASVTPSHSIRSAGNAATKVLTPIVTAKLIP